MTVEQMIAELQKQPPKDEVVIVCCEGGIFEIAGLSRDYLECTTGIVITEI